MPASIYLHDKNTHFLLFLFFYLSYIPPYYCTTPEIICVYYNTYCRLWLFINHYLCKKTRPTHVVDPAYSSCIILQMLRPLSRCNDVKKNALSLFTGTISSLKTKYRKMRRLGTRINSCDSRLLLQCYTLPGCTNEKRFVFTVIYKCLKVIYKAYLHLVW